MLEVPQALRDLCCFRQALALTRADLAGEAIDLSALPGLTSNPVLNRWLATSGGRKGRVSFDPAVKRMMKARFHELAEAPWEPEAITFSRSLEDGFSLLVQFEKKYLWGLGKTFKVNVAVNKHGNTRVGGESIFFVVNGGHTAAEDWTYGTRDDLDAALGGVADLLSVVLPVLTERSREAIAAGARDLNATPWTAREAYAVCARAGRAWASDAYLHAVENGDQPILGWAGREFGPGVGLDGRLAAHGVWRFRWKSAHARELEDVVLGVIGSPHTTFCREITSGIAASVEEPLDDSWADSSDLVAAAESGGAGEARGEDQIRRLMVSQGDQLKFGAHPTAVVAYLVESKAGRWKDIKYLCDRRTGEKYTLLVRDR
jgi:hypothetical protein